MENRRPALLIALLLSLLVHVIVVSSSETRLTDFLTDDEVLESRQPTRVQRVRLATRPAAPAPERTAQKKQHKTASEKPAQPSPAPAPAEQASSGSDDAADTGIADSPAEPAPAAPPQAPVATMAELPPAFPVQLVAELDARLNGLPVVLTQAWNMEGYRYAIRLSGSKFGFEADLESEGKVSPAGGLKPEASQLKLGRNVKSFTRYADGVIRYGKPDNPREAPLPVIPQDFASLPFHLAVTFDGRPQSLFVSTGRGVYQVRFSLVAEEKIRLPVGTLRTLHVAGEFFEPELGAMVRAFDIWLAADYLNFPVKVSGHLRSGDPIEYRVSALEMEGRMVLGNKADRSPTAQEDAIPEWLQTRLRSEGMNGSHP
jgi:hypothetical protein